METKEFYVVARHDYRLGFNLYFDEDEDEDEMYDHFLNLTYDRTQGPYLAYIITVSGGSDTGHVLYQQTTSTDTEAHDLVLRAFVQINHSLPFVVTGQTSSYKEEGYYPQADEKYKQPLPVDLDVDADRIYGIVFSTIDQKIMDVIIIEPLF